MTKTQLVTKSRAHAEQSISVRVAAARLTMRILLAFLVLLFGNEIAVALFLLSASLLWW